MYRVMIDPGHTAWNINPGVVSGYYEGTMAWNLAQYLIEELRAYGIEAGCTKEHINHALDVVPRGRMARGYDLFISLHSDACGTESVDRVTVFDMVDDVLSDIDEKSERFAKMMAPVVAEVIGTKDHYQVKSRPSSGDRNGDGVRNDNWLGVLHGAHEVGVPGVLIEHSFHTNRRSCEWLMDNNHLMQLAKAEASVIAEYFGINIEGVRFIDVPSNAWFKDSVQWAVDNKITDGVSKRCFAPDKACTRAEAMTMLWRMMASPEPDSRYNPFCDVKESDWFYKPVLWAIQQNITSGIDGTHFGPDNKCTRAQIVTFLWRHAGAPVTSGNEFNDVPDNAYYHDAVYWALNHGITSGIYSGHFGPEEPCVRAQVVTFLHRMSTL